MQIRLSSLSYEYFKLHDSWRVIEETMDDDDVVLEPALKNTDNSISKSNGEVWCLSSAKFANGFEYLAAAMCRGDSSDGPLLLTVWNGKEEVSLILPPAPSFVLEVDGPEAFCRKFNKAFTEVFPLTFEVVPLFEIMPSKRILYINP